MLASKRNGPSTSTTAGKLDDKHREFAAKLHKLKFIYGLYGALDGLSLSYSMVKYSFDLLYTDSNIASSDVMHDWMLTPAGIAAAATESITLISFSLLANIFDDDDEDAFKRYVAILWPYFRTAMKGMKNAYKGIRSTFQAIGMLSGQDLRYMIVPFGLVLGVLSAVNRIWLQYMVTERKAMMRANAELLAKIQDEGLLDLDACQALRARKIGRQSAQLRRAALLANAYNGAVDGLYLFMGAMGVASLAPPAFIVMTVFCAIYAVVNIVTRVYEEYDFQRKLVATQAKIELAICGKELEALLGELKRVQNQLIDIEYPLTPVMTPAKKALVDEQEALVQALELKMKEFASKQAYLRSQQTLSYQSAALSGLRNGLFAYSAIMSILFVTAMVCAMLMVPVSPVFLIACVSAGMACLIGFLAYALIKNRQHVRQLKVTEAKPHEKLYGMLKSLKNNIKVVRDLEPTLVQDSVRDGLQDPTPQFFFQEWFEVVRSFFSGLTKGQKAVDFAFNPLQKLDPAGHYQETLPMLVYSGISGLVHAAAWFFRADARGFGKPPIDKVEPSKIKKEAGPVVSIKVTTPQPVVELPTADSGEIDTEADELVRLLPESPGEDGGPEKPDDIKKPVPDSPARLRPAPAPPSSQFKRSTPYFFNHERRRRAYSTGDAPDVTSPPLRPGQSIAPGLM